MIGRVLRPAEGKPDAIVLDHSGAVFPPRVCRGSGRVDARSRPPRHKRRRISSATDTHGSRLLECSQCGAIRDSRRAVRSLRLSSAAAAACGVVRRRRSRPGRSLAPRSRRSSTTRPSARAGTPCWPGSATSAATSPAGSAHKYKEKFGTFPPWGARPSRSRRRPKFAPGCARARSPLRGAVA